MKDFITYLIKNLVDTPDAVEIDIDEQPDLTTVGIRVSQEDIAKVIGRQGRTIKALRTIVGTLGARFGRRIHLQVASD